MASGVKSTYMISAMGRMPAMAAPTAAPPMVASEIGVSSTRQSPNSLGQAAGGAVSAAVEADVLTHDEDVGVAGHLLASRLNQRVGVGDLPHVQGVAHRSRSFASAATSAAVVLDGA